MANRQSTSSNRIVFPRPRDFGTAAVSVRSRLIALWTRESLVRFALSFVLAIALWLYVTSKQNPTYIDYSQPLQIGTSYVRPGLVVTNPLQFAHVTIRLDSPSTLVTPSNFRVFVNLFNKKPGAYPALPVEVVADPGIHVGKVVPATVPVMVERVLQKRVPVAARLLRAVPKGYNIGPIRLTPNTVSVTGPQSIVSQIVSANIDLSLDKTTSSESGTFKPSLVDSQGVTISGTSGTVMEPPQVGVSVSISTALSYRSLPVLAYIRGVPKTGYGVVGVVVSPSEVTVRGYPSVLSRTASILTGSFWVSGRHRSFTSAVGLRLPDGVSSETRTVNVNVQLRPVDSSSSIEVGVIPDRVPSGLVAHIRPARVLVTVVGQASRLAAAAKQMRARLDLSRYTTGVSAVPVQVIAPPGFRIGNVYPSSVNVVLQPIGVSH